VAQHRHPHNRGLIWIPIEFTGVPAGKEIVSTHMEIVPGSLIEELPSFLWCQLPNWSRLIGCSFCNRHNFVPFTRPFVPKL
jgi:hypothetical protein